jgi:hypothetical protein
MTSELAPIATYPQGLIEAVSSNLKQTDKIIFIINLIKTTVNFIYDHGSFKGCERVLRIPNSIG